MEACAEATLCDMTAVAAPEAAATVKAQSDARRGRERGVDRDRAVVERWRAWRRGAAREWCSARAGAQGEKAGLAGARAYSNVSPVSTLLYGTGSEHLDGCRDMSHTRFVSVGCSM